MVNDPNFWKRFSTAVHEDEAAKEQRKDRPDLKHSYVQPQPSFASSAPALALPSPVVSAPAPTPLTPPPPPSLSLASRRKEAWEITSPPHTPTSAPATAPHQENNTGIEKENKKPRRHPSNKLRKYPSTSTRPLLSPASSLPPPSSSKPPIPPTPARHSFRCPSALSLNMSLSGRPRTAFKTWTTITANPGHRESWLESQNKKARQRTWICWSFWGVLAGVVAGVVVAVVILRKKGVI